MSKWNEKIVDKLGVDQMAFDEPGPDPLSGCHFAEPLSEWLLVLCAAICWTRTVNAAWYFQCLGISWCSCCYPEDRGASKSGDIPWDWGGCSQIRVTASTGANRAHTQLSSFVVGQVLWSVHGLWITCGSLVTCSYCNTVGLDIPEAVVFSVSSNQVQTSLCLLEYIG